MSQIRVSIDQAKKHFSKLLKQVTEGEEVIISEGNKPIAKLVPFEKPAARRKPGRDRGKAWIAPDFNAPLPEEWLAAFEGREPKKIKNRA